ncbi:hypothetical protein [Chitinophaga sp. OAE865]|uniref:hypothetical protein n=1 Tax=Chitinophaga sp. OAE865 TaxID=2817898 RepID=UPI001AE14746
MSWNYRVMKRKNKSGEYEFGIYEVYYDEEGNIESWTENPVTPVCSSGDGLLYELNLMIDALKKDILVYRED